MFFPHCVEHLQLLWFDKFWWNTLYYSLPSFLRNSPDRTHLLWLSSKYACKNEETILEKWFFMKGTKKSKFLKIECPRYSINIKDFFSPNSFRRKYLLSMYKVRDIIFTENSNDFIFQNNFSIHFSTFFFR